jgi:hypothetical protein
MDINTPNLVLHHIRRYSISVDTPYPLLRSLYRYALSANNMHYPSMRPTRLWPSVDTPDKLIFCENDRSWLLYRTPNFLQGVVDFVTRKGMEDALKKLDGSMLNGRSIRLYMENDNPRRSR